MNYQLIHYRHELVYSQKLKPFGHHARFFPETRDGIIELLILGKLTYETYEQFLFQRLIIPEEVVTWCTNNRVEIENPEDRRARINRQRIHEMMKIGMNPETITNVLEICQTNQTYYFDPKHVEELITSFRINQGTIDSIEYFETLKRQEAE